MSFKLFNVLIIFQTYINRVLTDLMNVICVIYLNDILIYSVDSVTHWDDVHKILDHLRKFQLYEHLKKCAFNIIEIEFLEFIVSTFSVSMNQSRVNTITFWLMLKTFHDVQSFLSFVNFYRRFIFHYSAIVSLLTKLFKRSKNDKQIESLI